MMICVQHRELWTAPSTGLSFATVLIQVRFVSWHGMWQLRALSLR